MNKLILFPLVFLFMLTVFSNVFTTYESTNSTTDVPHAGQRWFDLGSPESIILILTVALMVGMISGFTFLGSGFSDFSQTLMFDFAIFIGIWICLTVTASGYLFANALFSMLYLILTFIYVVGVGILASQGSSG